MLTVACWLDTLGCWMTTFARAASRPKTTWPCVFAAFPSCISIKAIAGCAFGTGVCPSMNCVRKSKG
jgi:hypothetical protein